MVEQRILGIDPGLNATGWGVIGRDAAGRTRALAHGVARSGVGTLAERLARLFAAIEAVIEAHGPLVMAVEQVFVDRNAQSALKLGQARGAALVAGQRHGLTVHEYTPRQIKQALTGHGGAEKAQVAFMVARLAAVRGRIASDAADALAVALCHAQRIALEGKLVRAAPAAALAMRFTSRGGRWHETGGSRRRGVRWRDLPPGKAP